MKQKYCSFVSRGVSSFLIFFLIFGVVINTEVSAQGDALSRAVEYLHNQSDSAGKTMALAAVGENPDVSYLKTFNGSNAISYAKPILALTSVGKDPRTYPDEDFVDKIKSFEENGQIGDPSTLNDDFWGILALSSAGVPISDSLLEGSKQFILNKKKQLAINPQKRIVGIVARLVEEKGYLELFEAFKDVLLKFPDTLLLIVGPKEPEKKDRINPSIAKKYNIQKNTLFLGERFDVDEIYPLMDIFVLPTHREGVGASILEASSMERPVIATNVGGCPEAIDDNKTGILIPLKDVKKLSEAIIYLFDNPEIAKEMGQCGRQKILKEFNQKLIFDILKTEYQWLINKKLR